MEQLKEMINSLNPYLVQIVATLLIILIAKWVFLASAVNAGARAAIEYVLNNYELIEKEDSISKKANYGNDDF